MRKHVFISAIVILTVGTVALPSSADANGSHARRVRLEDNCDPATFNAAFGDGVCVDHGNGRTVKLPEFLAKLNPVDFGHPKWQNKPDDVDLESGDSLAVVVRGGEFHTFTEVAEFGPGCLGQINDALGLTSPPPTEAQCGEFFATTGVLPNGLSTLTVSGLAPGTHKFMCEIHPWMRSVVTVEDDD